MLRSRKNLKLEEIKGILVSYKDKSAYWNQPKI